jgi:signal transduction histidine kinase
VDTFRIDCRDYFNRVRNPVAIIDNNLVLRFSNPLFQEMCNLNEVAGVPLLEALEGFCEDVVKLRVFREFVYSALRESPDSDTFLARCLGTHRITITRLKTESDLFHLLQFEPIAGAVNPETGEFLEDSHEVEERRLMEDKLRRRVRELSILHEISSVLLESRDLEHVYHIILTGVTFGQGLGFNRAFLLLYDEDTRLLTGRTAVGPATRDEADEIWGNLNERDMDLQSILHSYQVISGERNSTINNLAQEISIKLETRDSEIYKSFQQNHYGRLQHDRVTTSEDRQLLKSLGAGNCWITPIISYSDSKPKWRGVLVVDNFITGRMPQGEDIEALGICGQNLALTMERFDLIGELQIKIENLEELYQKYRESSQKLLFAEKLAAMGKVATRIAHEIKNPLVSIGGFALKLRDAIDPEDKLHRYATIVVDEVRRLENTLYSVLYFSNLHQTQPEPFQLVSLIDHCHELFEDVLARVEIKLEIEIAPGVDEINADKGQLEQVLINLIRNSIEAIGSDGCITLQVAADRDNYYFTIADSGPGIDIGNPEMPFESFFSTKATGTGLGLTITREIIDNHHGTISLHNTPRGGAEVKFQLPKRSGGDL